MKGFTLSIRTALGLVLGAQLALSTVAVQAADAAPVLCQKEANKKKLRVREDFCKDGERKIEFAGAVQNVDLGPIEDDVKDLDQRVDKVEDKVKHLRTRVDLVEDAATAPITNDRLKLETELMHLPGTEGEMLITTEEKHQVCALTRILYFQNPDGPGFDVCELRQLNDGRWTLSGQNNEFFCDAICF